MRTGALPHWAAIGESTFSAGIWFLYGVHRCLGRLPFRLCLYPVVLYYWATRPVALRASREYLERIEAASGALGTAPTWRHELRHFIAFAETLLDKLLAASGRYPVERVRYVGVEPLLRLLQRGQGVMLVTAHVGCLELCQLRAEHRTGLALNVLVHTRHAERFNRILRRLQPDSRVRLLQVSDVSAATAVLLDEKVARGEFVAIAGDRVPLAATGTTTASVDFLGKPAAFPVGPYVLAALLRCPLYSMLCVRERAGHAVHFELLAERVELPRGRRAAALAGYAASFAARLQRLLATAPYEWFNFFPFWRPAPDARDHEHPV